MTTDHSHLTDEQLRVMVAEECGWTKIEHSSVQMPWGMRPDSDPRTSVTEAVPHFHSSLDACATFEAELDKDEVLASKYTDELYDAHAGNGFMTITATARQRCIAYLKVKGKL